MKKQYIFSKMLVLGLLFLSTSHSFSQTFPVTTLVDNGDPDNRINFVILGDGYQASEMADFLADANAYVADMFSTQPYEEYQDYFNVYAIEVPSNESGADHPGDGDQDSGGLVFPTATVDTYFDSTFDYAGIHRLMVATNSTAINNVLAANVPNYDHAVMIVNSPHYGGSGGAIAAATSGSSAAIIVHEIGHSFVNLADEYSGSGGSASERANVTQETDRNLIKWNSWIDASTPIPTPLSNTWADIPGLFEGAAYNTTGWYRPEYYCKMRSNGVPFCAVCTEETVVTIQGYVNTIDSYLPSNLEVFDAVGTVNFSIETLAPTPNTLEIEWLLNGNVMTLDVLNFSLSTSSLPAGTNTVTARVTDMTALSRKAASVNEVTWTLGSSPCTSNDLPTIPYNYSFENGLGNWTLVNVENDAITWLPVTADICNGTAISIDNYNNSTIGAIDRFEQYFDLSNSNNTQLHFDIAHARYSDTYNDELRVNVTDCNGVTTTVYSKVGADLATMPNTTSVYVPQSCDEWRTEMVDLSAFDGQTVQISFENVSGWSNNLYVSKINIFADTPAECGALAAEDLNSTIDTSNGLSVTLSWPAVPNAEAYQLAGRKAGGTTKVFPETQLTYRTFNGGIAYNTSYQWSVKVKCDGAWTDYALPPASFTTPNATNKNQINSYDIFDDVEKMPLSFSLYPNPAKTSMSIHLDNQANIFDEKTATYQLQILDISGKIVYSNSLQAFDTPIDISHLNAGSYFVHIQTAEQNAIEKLIVY